LLAGEQALALQSFLQLHEGGVEVAHAGAAADIHVQLVVTPWRVEGDQGAHSTLSPSRGEAGVLGAP
jgi:hypothetical protein